MVSRYRRHSDGEKKKKKANQKKDFRKLQHSSPKNFSIKGQIINMLGFEGHMVPVTTIQFWCCSTKTDIDNK